MLTDEQAAIVDKIQRTHVSVSAVAGSGKSTLLYSVCAAYPHRKILLITYSSRLKDEARVKVKEKGLENLTVHSFHSAAISFYNAVGHTDRTLGSIIDNETPLKQPIDYDTFLLDETQDMNDLLYRFTLKLLTDNTPPNPEEFRLAVVGDPQQSIFQYAGASPQYLTEAHVHFGALKGLPKYSATPWEYMSLSITFRVPQKVIHFLEQVCGYPENKMVSHQPDADSPPVRYVLANLYGERAHLAELELLLDVFEPGEIFILCPSVTALSVVRFESMIHQELSHRNIPIFVVTSDTPADPRVTDGKLVICSVHSSKGMERRAVMIFNFHGTKHHPNPETITPEWYVAPTRSLEALVILHHHTASFLNFVDEARLREQSDAWELVEYSPHKESNRTSPRPENSRAVSKFLKHLNHSTMNECMRLITVETLREPDPQPITLEQFAPGIYGPESVSAVNGVAIPSYIEYMLTGNSHVFQTVFPGQEVTPEQFGAQLTLCAAVKKVSADSEFEFLARQLREFKWISRRTFEACFTNLKALDLSDDVQFELSVKNRQMHGYMDLVDHGHHKVYELKCTSQLSDEHALQVALYAYLHDKPEYSYYLFNVLSRELVRVTASRKDLEALAGLLVARH